MRVRSALTRRGWALLAIAGTAALAGYLVGIVELYPMAAAAAVLVLSARAWVGARTWDVRASRSIRPTRVPAGGEARVVVAVRNHASGRSPLITVRDSFADGRPAGTFAVAPLGRGEARTAHYRLPAPRRGVLQFRPLEVQLCDPFGLASVVRVAAPAASLTIHPAVHLVPHYTIPSDSDRDQKVSVPLLGRGGDEFYALREYQAGDDLRQVHWVSTARTDELMIRQPQNLWRGKTTVVVDARTRVHQDASFEEGLSAAASLAVSGLRGGMQVRVVVLGGHDSGMGMGPGHEGTVLDTLAVASPTTGVSLPSQLRSFAVGGPIVMVTTDAASASDVSTAARAAGRSDSVLLLLNSGARSARRGDDAGAGVPGVGGGRCKVVRVESGQSWVEAWLNRQVALPC